LQLNLSWIIFFEYSNIANPSLFEALFKCILITVMTEKLRSLFEESLNQLLFGHSGAFIGENILDSDGPVR
jgi:hypothetical protein